MSAAAELLRTTLADRRVLLVVDDVWSTAACRAFGVTGRHGRVLFTSRVADALAAVGSDVVPIGPSHPTRPVRWRRR